MNIPTFYNFRENWVKFCKVLDKKELDLFKRNKIQGKKFEEKCYHILKELIPTGYRIVYQKKIKGINYKFDFLLIKSDCLEFFYDIKPSEVLAAFEVKAHGFYSYKSILRMKDAFKAVKGLNRSVKLFYITFKETNNYDNKVNEILSDFSKHNYRLSDSGNGKQLVPEKYFSKVWDKLINDLKSLNS